MGCRAIEKSRKWDVAQTGCRAVEKSRNWDVAQLGSRANGISRKKCRTNDVNSLNLGSPSLMPLTSKRLI